MILAAGLQDWVDFGVIIAILLMNAIVGECALTPSSCKDISKADDLSGWYQEKCVLIKLGCHRVPLSSSS